MEDARLGSRYGCGVGGGEAGRVTIDSPEETEFIDETDIFVEVADISTQCGERIEGGRS